MRRRLCSGAKNTRTTKPSVRAFMRSGSPRARQRHTRSTRFWVCSGAGGVLIATMQKRLAAVRDANERSRHIENLRSFGPEFDQAKSLEEVEALPLRLIPLYRNTIRDW